MQFGERFVQNIDLGHDILYGHASNNTEYGPRLPS